MGENGWKRLKESKVKEYGGMLPSRVVLEYNEGDQTYRTFLETFDRSGTPGFKYGRHFYWEEEALADFNKRSVKL